MLWKILLEINLTSWALIFFRGFHFFTLSDLSKWLLRHPHMWEYASWVFSGYSTICIYNVSYPVPGLLLNDKLIRYACVPLGCDNLLWNFAPMGYGCC